MSYVAKLARFIRSGGSGAIVVRLDSLAMLERKFTVSPENLLGPIADNALAAGLADVNRYLPDGLSVNIVGVDFSDIQAELNEVVAARIAVIGLPVDENDPVIKAALQHAAAQVSARLQQDGMGLTEFIWRSRDDARVRPEHQQHDDQQFFWATPPGDGTPGEAYGCRCSAEPVFGLEDLPEGATCEKLTAEKLLEVFPEASEERLQAFAEAIDAVITIGKLDSPDRLAHFFGQAGVEMGPEALLEENLRYRAERLAGIYDYFEEHPDEAIEFGKTKDHPADPEAIANRAYANRNGNGDVESGDGWTFRGRGMFQTTGRGNYQRATEMHRDLFGEDIDFVAHPELLEKPKYAARTAVIYWLDHEFTSIADLGTTSEVTNQITQIINLHTSTYAERSDKVMALADGNVFQGVCRFSVTKPTFAAT